MTPQEIAELFLKEIELSGMEQAIERWRPELTRDVLRIINLQANQLFFQQSPRAWDMVRAGEALAMVVGTREAQAAVDFVKGNGYFALNQYQEALVYWRQAELFYSEDGHKLYTAGLKVNRVIALRDLGNYQEALAQAEIAR